MKDSGSHVNWLQAFVAAIVFFAVLKITRPVALPLAFATFLIVVAWPLQVRLEKKLPSWLALTLTFLTFLFILGVFVGALALSANAIVRSAPEFFGQLKDLYTSFRSWAAENGVPVSPNQNDIDQWLQRGLNYVGTIFQGLFSVFSLLGLVLIMLLFGLLEVRKFRAKIEANFSRNLSSRVLNSFDSITAQFQRYIVTKTAISIMTGVSIGVFAWVAGLKFAFIWGLLAFFLNYIPAIGSNIVIILLTLFAYGQFNTSGRTVLVFFCAAGIQLFFGNWLDPRLQGKYLSLSPLVILLSVIFWGWIWGIAGAILGVPLTIGVVIALDQFERTRWITALLAEFKEGDQSS